MYIKTTLSSHFRVDRMTKIKDVEKKGNIHLLVVKEANGAATVEISVQK